MEKFPFLDCKLIKTQQKTHSVWCLLAASASSGGRRRKFSGGEGDASKEFASGVGHTEARASAQPQSPQSRVIVNNNLIRNGLPINLASLSGFVAVKHMD